MVLAAPGEMAAAFSECFSKTSLTSVCSLPSSQVPLPGQSKPVWWLMARSGLPLARLWEGLDVSVQSKDNKQALESVDFLQSAVSLFSKTAFPQLYFESFLSPQAARN